MEKLTRKSLCIVHVEDDYDFARLCGIFLQREGFEQPVIHCADGILALHYFSMIAPEEAPHVIFLDLHMPNMNGLEVLHWLRHNHGDHDVAVYLLTSSEEPEDRHKAAREHATGYILKSPLFGKLIHQLDQVIAKANERSTIDALKAESADQAFSESGVACQSQAIPAM